MSDRHDHPHPHKHDHDHSHDHDHHHHDHDHDHGSPSASAPEPLEDAGSQALAEALRSSFVIVKVIMIILIVIFFASGVFTVPSQERAIVLRFGKPVGTGEQQLLQPGVHWSFPYPIDEVVRIPIGQIQSVTSTVGWYAVTPEQELTGDEPYAGPTLNPAVDGYVITGDGNVIHVRATMRYRVSNPLNYALNFVNASNVVQNNLNNALLATAAKLNVDSALKSAEFREQLEVRVRDLVESQNLGIDVEQVTIDRRIPPRQTKDAFDAVTSADLERRQSVNNAQGYANRVRSEAIGQSNAIVNVGITEAAQIVQSLNAEAESFSNLLEQYRVNPQQVLARLQLESLHRIMTNNAVEKWPILRNSDGKPIELRLLLNREQKKPVGQTQAP